MLRMRGCRDKTSMVKKLIIQILSDHLFERQTVLPADIDMAALAGLANMHQVDGIVYKQCGQPPVPPLARAYAAAMFYYANRSGMLARVSAALAEKEIPFFTIKGPGIAQYYPIPALRTMSDCDIVVPPGHLEDAVTVMLSLGFVSAQENYDHEWSGITNSLHFEVHDKLVKSDEDASDRQSEFFNNYMSYINGNTLDDSFHFLYLLMHLRKHLRIGGTGIRLFFDLAIMIRNCKTLNWTWIEEKIRYLGIETVAHFCLTLTESWFSVAPPVPFERSEPDLIEKAKEHILNGGLFGNFDEMFRDNYSTDMLNRGKGPLWWRRAIAFLRDIFLRYDYLKRYPGLSYLNGRPWLLPFAWVHRLLILLKRKDKSSIRNAIRRNTVSKSDLDKRKEFLKKMGIDR